MRRPAGRRQKRHLQQNRLQRGGLDTTMKKGDILEGFVSRVNYPGKGIVDTAEGTCIVKNVLPGQRILLRVTKKRRGKAEGSLQEVLEKAPHERAAPCPHFGSCGGCLYLHLPFAEELELKRVQVERLLEGAMQEGARLSGIPEEYLKVSDWFEGILPAPREYEYRNKMEYTFGNEYKDGPLALGMHRRGGFYDIVTVDGCRITDPDFSLILRTTLHYFQETVFSETAAGSMDPFSGCTDLSSDSTDLSSGCTDLSSDSMDLPAGRLPFFHRIRHTGYLRHLLVRKATFTGEILVDLITTTQLRPDLSGFTQTLLTLEKEGLLKGRFAGILHTNNDSPADVVTDQGTEILYGQDFFTEELLGLRFKVTPFSFFQTNSHGAEVLYDTARRYLLETETGKSGGTVYDLYCGTGTIAQLMAPYADKVIGVEIVEEAVEAAKVNAARNGLTNCEFIAGDVLKVLDTIPEKPDTIILDPPRDGIHPKALPRILSYGVENILYISCKPTSLARDLPAFLAAGYRPVRGICVDQFPWTSSVETVVLLSHKDPDSHIHVKVEFGEGKGKVPLEKIAERAEKYKPKEKVTYKKIKEYIEDKFGFKVHTAYIAEVKRAYGLPMYEAPNAVEELKQPRKHPTEEKVKAISDALVHFGLINKKQASTFEIAHLSAV